MAQTINGVVGIELRDGFSESIQEGGPRGAKSFLVAWADRYAFANGLLGLATYSGGTSVGFSTPAKWPESSNLWCSGVAIRGIGAQYQGAKQIGFDYAVVSATYGVPNFNFSAAMDPTGQNNIDPSTPLIYASQELDFGYCTVPMPSGTILANSKFVPSMQAMRTLGVVTLNVTLYRCPFLIPASTRQAAGKLNNATYLGCAAGTLRFDGVKPHRDALADGTIAQTTLLSWSWRPEQPWDYVPDPGGSSTWYQAKYGDGTAWIPRVDFSGIIPSAYVA